MPAVYGAPRLRGRSLGIIGCGRIGTALARRGLALGLRVAFYDPYRPDGLDKALGIECCLRLDELLTRSEFLSLNCPLTEKGGLTSGERRSNAAKSAFCKPSLPVKE